MTPTLFGRFQTRIFLVVVVGTLWTLLVGPFLPRPTGATLGDVYGTAFAALLVVLVAGLVWELSYHAAQQLRWEKDWPTLFGLITGINEGIAAYVLLRSGVLVDRGEVPSLTFAVHFATTWIVLWLWVNGPMRVLFIRWRFRGGRLL
jgi:hypothetical protein